MANNSIPNAQTGMSRQTLSQHGDQAQIQMQNKPNSLLGNQNGPSMTEGSENRAAGFPQNQNGIPGANANNSNNPQQKLTPAQLQQSLMQQRQSILAALASQNNGKLPANAEELANKVLITRQQRLNQHHQQQQQQQQQQNAAQANNQLNNGMGNANNNNVNTNNNNNNNIGGQQAQPNQANQGQRLATRLPAFNINTLNNIFNHYRNNAPIIAKYSEAQSVDLPVGIVTLADLEMAIENGTVQETEEVVKLRTFCDQYLKNLSRDRIRQMIATHQQNQQNQRNQQNNAPNNVDPAQQNQTKSPMVQQSSMVVGNNSSQQGQQNQQGQQPQQNQQNQQQPQANMRAGPGSRGGRGKRGRGGATRSPQVTHQNLQQQQQQNQQLQPPSGQNQQQRFASPNLMDPVQQLRQSPQQAFVSPNIPNANLVDQVAQNVQSPAQLMAGVNNAANSAQGNQAPGQASGQMSPAQQQQIRMFQEQFQRFARIANDNPFPLSDVTDKLSPEEKERIMNYKNELINSYNTITKNRKTIFFTYIKADPSKIVLYLKLQFKAMKLIKAMGEGKFLGDFSVYEGLRNDASQLFQEASIFRKRIQQQQQQQGQQPGNDQMMPNQQTPSQGQNAQNQERPNFAPGDQQQQQQQNRPNNLVPQNPINVRSPLMSQNAQMQQQQQQQLQKAQQKVNPTQNQQSLNASKPPPNQNTQQAVQNAAGNNTNNSAATTAAAKRKGRAPSVRKMSKSKGSANASTPNLATNENTTSSSGNALAPQQPNQQISNSTTSPASFNNNPNSDSLSPSNVTQYFRPGITQDQLKLPAGRKHKTPAQMAAAATSQQNQGGAVGTPNTGGSTPGSTKSVNSPDAMYTTGASPSAVTGMKRPNGSSGVNDSVAKHQKLDHNNSPAGSLLSPKPMEAGTPSGSAGSPLSSVVSAAANATSRSNSGGLSSILSALNSISELTASDMTMDQLRQRALLDCPTRKVAKLQKASPIGFFIQGLGEALGIPDKQVNQVLGSNIEQLEGLVEADLKKVQKEEALNGKGTSNSKQVSLLRPRFTGIPPLSGILSNTVGGRFTSLTGSYGGFGYGLTGQYSGRQDTKLFRGARGNSVDEQSSKWDGPVPAVAIRNAFQSLEISRSMDMSMLTPPEYAWRESDGGDIKTASHLTDAHDKTADVKPREEDRINSWPTIDMEGKIPMTFGGHGPESGINPWDFDEFAKFVDDNGLAL